MSLHAALPAQAGSQAGSQACLPSACGWLDRQRLSLRDQQWPPDQQARDKGLSEQSAWACVPGWGQENRGGAVGLVTCSSECSGGGDGRAMTPVLGPRGTSWSGSEDCRGLEMEW